MLKTEYQEEYITNASVLIALKHLRDYKLNHWKNKKGLGKNLWEEALSFNDILEKTHGRRHTMDLAEQPFIRKFKEFLSSVTEENSYNFESQKRNYIIMKTKLHFYEGLFFFFIKLLHIFVSL